MTRDNLEARRHVQSSDSGNDNLLREVHQLSRQVQDIARTLCRTDDEVGRTINSRMHDDIYNSCFDRPNNHNRRPEPGIWNGNGWGDRENGSRRNRDNGNSEDRQQRHEDKIDRATEYLTKNFDRLDLKRDGQIDRREIDFALRHETDRDARRNLTTLRDNYDEIADAHHEWNKNGLTRADAQEMHHDLDRNKQIRGFADALQNGDSPLFAALDSAKNGKFDGRISRADLEKFVQQSEIFGQLGVRDGVHTQANRDVVAQMLNQWDNRDSAAYQMRDGGKYITIETLSRALEENQYRKEYRPQVVNYKNVGFE